MTRGNHNRRFSLLAAGLIVLKEAGGYITAPDGGEAYPGGDVVAGNPFLQPKLRDVVNEGVAAIARARGEG